MLHSFARPLVSLAVLVASAHAMGQGGFWTPEDGSRNAAPAIDVAEYRTFHLDVESLERWLDQVPVAAAFEARESEVLLELPLADGTFETFRVVNSPIMAPALAERHPEIQVYAGQGVESPEATVRFDLTPQGFHAMILGAGQTTYIDPYQPGDRSTVIAYTRAAFYASTAKHAEGCQALEDPSSSNLVTPRPHSGGKEVLTMGRPATAVNRADNGTQLRTYRLALACTGEYASFHGGTVANVLAAMNTSMARVNGLFERDACLTMQIVANNDQLVFLNANTDPYSNTNGSAMLSQNISTCNSVIGSANYDIGHVFSTGGGGVAYLQSPCGSSKAGGVTGQGAPVGDPFDVDYVAHEMGHQFGGNHTQNNSCNRATSAAYEPGSASTIMGYAGICAPNLQSNSDDHFHNHSINEMIAFTVNGNGNTCATTSATGNTLPTVNAGVDGLVVPKSTPLELTATGSDPDGDAVTFNWEEYDLGPATASGDNNLTNPSGNQPIFRSFSSTTSPTRTLPRLVDLVNNTTTIGEHLPTYSRQLNFKCSIRDNRAGGGGFSDDLKTMSVTANAGPFVVLAPNGGGSFQGNSNVSVTWDVAGTDGNGVNCSSVDIYLSTDGGYTFPTLLVGGTPNDGAASVLLPNVPTSQARIKVKASNNVFFDISNGNFAIVPGAGDIDYDAAVIGLQGVSPGACESVLDPVATVFNAGQLPLGGFDVSWVVDGAAPTVISWTGSLGSGESVDVPLCEGGACLTLPDGNHEIEVTVSLTGATDENATNNTYSTSFETASGAQVTWTLVTDNYPEETTWSVTDEAGGVVWSGGPYASAGTTYTETVCLPYGCYTLTVNDSYGDGICCAWGNGSFELSSAGTVLASGGQFATSTTASFCLESAAVLGCTDAGACNYNPDANENDGTCVYPEVVETACGTCAYDCNGTCLADSDGDGVCDSCECEGCQDVSACNYDASATDPGMCEYPDSGYDCAGNALCVGDLNGNGAIDVGDVLAVLAEFGCVADCGSDVTGDGVVTVSDILALLSDFGTECP